MNYRLLDLLACPACGASLRLQVFEEVAREVVEGALSCKCSEVYPIIESVPRLLPGVLKEHPEFAQRHSRYLGNPNSQKGSPTSTEVADKTRDSFSYEWGMHDYSGFTWETHLAQRKSLFLHYLQTTPEDVRGKLILDAGCGNGTLTAAISGFGVEVVGMDLSSSVVRAQKEKVVFAKDSPDRVHFVQGDVRKPPFRSGVFDAIYCDGVLHHTPNTRQGLMSLAPLVKPGGKFFVWLYRKDSSLANRLKRYTISLVRPITSRLPHGLLFKLCLLGALPLLFVVQIRRAVGDKSRESIPIRLKAVNLFDTFSVQFDRVHTYQEVAAWFKEAGFQKAIDVTVPRVAAGFGFGALGIRKGSQEKVRG